MRNVYPAKNRSQPRQPGSHRSPTLTSCFSRGSLIRGLDCRETCWGNSNRRNGLDYSRGLGRGLGRGARQRKKAEGCRGSKTQTDQTSTTKRDARLRASIIEHRDGATGLPPPRDPVILRGGEDFSKETARLGHGGGEAEEALFACCPGWHCA